MEHRLTRGAGSATGSSSTIKLVPIRHWSIARRRRRTESETQSGQGLWPERIRLPSLRSPYGLPARDGRRKNKYESILSKAIIRPAHGEHLRSLPQRQPGIGENLWI